MLRRSPGHQVKDQRDRATYKCPEVCVCMCGRWVRFTFGHDIGGMAVDEKNRKREAGEASASRSPIRSDGSILHAGEPRKFSHFSPARYLTLPSPTSNLKLDYRSLGGFFCLCVAVL